MLNREIISIGDDSNVLLETLNARNLAIKFSKFVDIIRFSSTITELKVGSTSISLFDDIEALVDNSIRSVYNIKKIEHINNLSFLLRSSILTKTSNFILPVLFLNRFNKDFFLYDIFFENCFINKNNFKELILFYRFSASPLFLQFEKIINTHPQFIKKIDIDPYHICIIFKIPDEYSDAVDLFLEGKYSKLPEGLKKDIMKFFNYKSDGDMAQILSKSPLRRKQLELEFEAEIPSSVELYEIPNKDVELWQLN